MYQKLLKKQWLFPLLLIVGFTLWYLIGGGGDTILLNFEEETLSISVGEEYSYSIPFERIDTLSLEQLGDTGAVLSGAEDGTQSYGRRENERFGQYDLCICLEADNCIVLTDKDGGVLVFSYQNTESTRMVYDGMTDMLNK